ncbi:MAG: hypothetical protein VX304_07040 [Planctomycetota bacterium]|nr:hypothetical protein [Planctomycetota bacterium]
MVEFPCGAKTGAQMKRPRRITNQQFSQRQYLYSNPKADVDVFMKRFTGELGYWRKNNGRAT